MISVDKLNDYLIDNVDAIVEILQELGFENIHQKKNEIRCSWEPGSNPSATVINVKTLLFYCFSNGEKGNLISLIMLRLKKGFPQSLKWAAELLGLEKSKLESKVKIKPVFNGFFKRMIHEDTEENNLLKTYDLNKLEPYSGKLSHLFAQDGINYDTQRFFQVGYDNISNRITIPQWSIEGELVGIMGRLNVSQVEPDEMRWLPIIPCQRGHTLYGYHFNYAEINKKRYCFIGESEKFVMQLRSMGVHNALATCGCNISSLQERYIKSLFCKRVILSYDEGLEEEQIREQAKKIEMCNPIFNTKVGYIYDSDGEILKKGTKNSPSDLGKGAFESLVKTKIKWL